MAVLLLGLVLVAQGTGKLADLHGYAAALPAFQLIPAALIRPVAALWTAAELFAGLGLLRAALRGRPARGPAAVAVAVALGYAILTVSAFARGLTVENCTCFGVFLRQRLSAWVLVQDAYVLAWSIWVAAKMQRPGGRLAPRLHT